MGGELNKFHYKFDEFPVRSTVRNMADNDFAYRQEDAEKRRRRREQERQRRLRHAREEYIKKKNQEGSH